MGFVFFIDRPDSRRLQASHGGAPPPEGSNPAGGKGLAQLRAKLPGAEAGDTAGAGDITGTNNPA